MDYHSPTSITEVVELLSADAEARCLAGGATLMAMINAELLSPDSVISLRTVSELAGIEVSGSKCQIGAMTRHADVAAHSLPGGLQLVAAAASRIGYPAIRAVGTIGGSVAHADPSADYPTALLAVDASVEIAGPSGRRSLPIEQFFLDFFTTALEDSEIVTGITLDSARVGNQTAYRKIARSDGDFAVASVAVSGQFVGDEIEAIRVAVGGCASTPVFDQNACHELKGERLTTDTLEEFADAYVALCDPIDDVRGSAAYRRTLVRRLIPAAITAAARA